MGAFFVGWTDKERGLQTPSIPRVPSSNDSAQRSNLKKTYSRCSSLPFDSIKCVHFRPGVDADFASSEPAAGGGWSLPYVTKQARFLRVASSRLVSSRFVVVVDWWIVLLVVSLYLLSLLLLCL